MHRPSIVPIAIVVCLQFSLGYANNDAANTNSETSQQTSLSRAKRGSYDMMRLGRGLHMLRLGKRDYEPVSEENHNAANALLWLLSHDEISPSDLESYVANYHEDDVEEPVHWRSRRSTSASNVAIPAEVLQQTNSAPKEVVPVDVKGVKGDEVLVDFPDNVYFTEDDLDDSIIEPQEGGEDEEKRSLGMLRLGKRQLSMLRLGKRSLGMLRLGKREDEEEKRSLGMLRLGKRQLSMLRLGKRSLGMLRLGKRPDENLDEVYSDEEDNMMDEDGKRAMSMLRLGKRPMSMLRLGKRPMSMLRLGKRPMSMLRLGKRPMSMLRLGKRPMSMLRLGKREDEEKRDLSKRSAI